MMDRIRLDAMHERHRALTPAIAGAYEEAASVCLIRNHASPVEITLSDNGSEAAAEIAWIEPDSRIRDAWAERNRRNRERCVRLCHRRDRTTASSFCRTA